MIKIVFSICLLLAIPCSVVGQSVDTNYVDGRIYVRSTASSSIDFANYDSSNVVLNAILSTYGVTEIKQPFNGINSELDRTFEFVFTEWTLVDNMLNDLNNFSEIEYAEKKPLHKISLVPNDVHPSQWALAKIQATDAWDITTGSGQVRIAIVDNAVSNVHEDLVNNIWINTGEVPNNGLDDDLNGFVDDYQGYDVADGDANPNPPSSAGSGSAFTHGTHCAGIASSSTNNGVGIASIGFNTSIIPVKCSPDASTSDGAALTNAYDGVYYAMMSNADIISMSFGSESPSLTGESLISSASQMGIVLIAAAGNSATNVPHYPAAYANVIGVGATNASDQITWFSNYGSAVDVMAPGSGIYSTLSGTGSEYGNKSGTSMACPMVAGLAGLVLAQNPQYSPAEVELAIESGCDPIDLINPGFEGQMGSGRINAYKTLSASSSLTENSIALTVFPNPAQGEVKIDVQVEGTKVNWVALDGNVVETEVISQNQSEGYTLRTPKEAGVYLLRLHLESGILSKRVIVLPH